MLARMKYSLEVAGRFPMGRKLLLCKLNELFFQNLLNHCEISLFSRSFVFFENNRINFHTFLCFPNLKLKANGRTRRIVFVEDICSWTCFFWLNYTFGIILASGRNEKVKDE